MIGHRITADPHPAIDVLQPGFGRNHYLPTHILSDVLCAEELLREYGFYMNTSIGDVFELVGAPLTWESPEIAATTRAAFDLLHGRLVDGYFARIAWSLDFVKSPWDAEQIKELVA